MYIYMTFKKIVLFWAYICDGEVYLILITSIY